MIHSKFTLNRIPNQYSDCKFYCDYYESEVLARLLIHLKVYIKLKVK